MFKEDRGNAGQRQQMIGAECAVRDQGIAVNRMNLKESLE
jgi:hypothetical protein